ARIIRPRLREILHLARQSVDEALGPLEITVGKVILTGGTAMVRGLEELARKQFNLPIRLGKPLGVQGLTDVVASPTHATAVGLVRHAATFAAHQPQTRTPRIPRPKPAPRAPVLNGEEVVTTANGVWERIKGMFKNFF
ncbi:MAG: cell division protein FtsA, partial [Meiothermus sp.]